MTNAHEFSFAGIDGETITLRDFAGRAILIVNVASACGFTPQYGPLQQLHMARGGADLTVLGVPCNDFGGQEPGTEGQIKDFCETRFGVTFPMTGKAAILGADRHPFYDWVRTELGEDALPRWNFHKYLIGPDGALAGSFKSNISPTGPEITEAIEAALAR